MSESAAERPAPKRKCFFRFVGDVNVASISVTLVGIAIGVWLGLKKIESAKSAVNTQIQNAQNTVSGEIHNVEREVLGRKLLITSPKEGSSVRMNDIVRGRTPFPNDNTYLIVTPLGNKVDYVQEGPINVDRAGLWTAPATFSTGAVGVGEQYMIRALSTKSLLPAGSLNVPADAVFSDAVTVVRR